MLFLQVGMGMMSIEMMCAVVKERFGCFEVNGAFSDSLLAEEGNMSSYIHSHMQRAGVYHIIQLDTSWW